mgnify:CR=1 FL=1
MSARLRQLREELAVLTRQSARATTRVSAPTPGVFSSLVDGYETRLTPETVSKLITSDTWYFAANLPQEAARRLEEGDIARLRFSGELNRDVEMTVDRVGATEGGKTLVVFSSNRYLTLTTLLRHQTAELVFESWSGLRIPKQALRLVEFTQEAPDSGGAASTASKIGVYALVNGRTEFREADILYEGSDYYVVRPLGSGRKILRAGDSVITQGTGLQDGLLLEG